MLRASYATMQHHAYGHGGGEAINSRFLPIKTIKATPRVAFTYLLYIELNALNADLLEQANTVVRAVWIGIDNTSNTRLND